MKPIDRLHSLGQSIWYDNIERRLLEDGSLANLIARGDIRGVTSNPSIFNKAILSSSDYDQALQPMAWAGWSPERIFFQLAIDDIRRTADLFLPLYQNSRGGDGYVSLEVNPNLAHDTRGTVTQAKKLWAQVNRPNLMIKIPATKEGIPAVQECIAAGLNINITLIFALKRYQAVLDAYLAGLEMRLRKGERIDQIASVASFFISRVDTKVDQRLVEMAKKPELKARSEALLGKAAIANARVAYDLFKRHCDTPHFILLKNEGARTQRPLWASTSTKNPAYRDVLYVEQLIGPETVNTIPPTTLDAFRDHGVAALTLDKDLLDARADLLALDGLGMSMEQVTAELEEEGVAAFATAFKELLTSINNRSMSFQQALGGIGQVTARRYEKMEKQKTATRIWQHDPTLWVKDPSGMKIIRERLGWLDAPAVSLKFVRELVKFRDTCLKDGFSHVLLLGMGGSSLAPEVMRDIYAGAINKQKALSFSVLDSTDPGQVAAAEKWAPAGHTLYIVASKSGGTAEVDAMFRHFWARVEKESRSKAGSAFIAITDPGTILEAKAKEYHFRKVFPGERTVGGRNSALTIFGLLPAVLMGIDVMELLGSAVKMAEACGPDVPAGANPGLMLGAMIGEAALLGRNKLTIITDELFDAFGPWLEQLVAESSGKQGKGILPVVGEPPLDPVHYGRDRLFIYIRSSGFSAARVEAIRKASHPVATLEVNDPHDLGGEFFRWEFATAVACIVLGVNAFDQPDVQDNKDRTVAKINEYREMHALPEGKPVWEDVDYAVFGNLPKACKSLEEVLRLFSARIATGDYIALNAYLPRNEDNLAILQEIRAILLQFRGNATTLGFGPRFLHSTGQLHKGGDKRGVFFQITSKVDRDIPIPGQPFSFAILERAQALGDLDALQSRRRHVIRIHLKKPGLADLVEIFKKVFD
ncbi:MAG: bifunctional transaldolase/phosoglucose isomerase [Anaerolineaceae bacterium]|nr:bifunctional transaldolase/phosoglucose isomerase [Anaerolineaceae bacterium]